MASLSRTALSRNGLPSPETVSSSRNGSLLQKRFPPETILLSTLIPLPDHFGEMRVSEININRRNIYEWKPISYFLLYIGISG
jgi:hypothetical protein